jgi:glycosyltransferase involved in cell wall biosynthesis
MNPLLINSYDTGGAANACLRLHQGLLQQQINSRVLLKNKTNLSIPETYKFTAQLSNSTLGQKLSRQTISVLKCLKLYKAKADTFIANRPAGLEIFSYPFSSYDITQSEQYRQADIVNLHWTVDLLDYPSFFRKKDKPVVWTLHDQNPFTGGEHYVEEYIGMNADGYPIKREVTKQEKEKFNEILDVKEKALKGVENLRIIALCNWMAREVKNSALFGSYKVDIIPNGLDSAVYKPRNKEYSRELLNIPQDKLIILFVSASVNSKRKGFEYLLKAFETVNNRDVVLMSIGSKESGLVKAHNIIELGMIYDELLISIIYSAADVFVIPSLMDNLPNTVLESIMCGTPVIGFPVGGIPDMVEDGFNGYLTEEISAPALARTIERFLDTKDQFNSQKIREQAVQKYDLPVQAKRYIELFERILGEGK